MPLPSEISFCSLLQYSPRGESDASAHSRRITRAVKSDSFVDGHRILPFAARRIAEVLAERECLRACLGPEAAVVPVPRSAPLVAGGLWPSLRLAEELVNAGVAARVLPCLERATALRKSATAEPRKRPKAIDHYHTLRVASESSLILPSRLCLVDDVVTRGATLLGAFARVRDAFPNADISAFALVRTVSEGEIDSVLNPAAGSIQLRQGHTHREP